MNPKIRVTIEEQTNDGDWVFVHEVIHPVKEDPLLDRIVAVFNAISYKPGWTANYSKKKLIDGTFLYLVFWTFSQECTETGKMETWNTRKYYISPHMTHSEIVQTMYLAAEIGERHEILESFRYRNKILFNPHNDLDALIDANIPKQVRQDPSTYYAK